MVNVCVDQLYIIEALCDSDSWGQTPEDVFITVIINMSVNGSSTYTLISVKLFSD